MSRLFAYSPLTEPDHIRLFLLQPAVDRNDDLVGSLQHLSLNDHYHDLIDSYTALSYVWGDPTPADTIILGGQPFGITANLGAALRDLRDATRTHRIWADALCIDQSNIPERNQQVLLMGDIYFRANSTVIYLGALTSHAEVVIQEVTRTISTGISEKSSSSSNIILDDMTEEGGILAQAWFYRVWVLQELVLSRDPWVQFGSKRIRWDDICHLLIPLLRKGRRDHFTGLENMNKIRIEYWKYRHPSLSNDHHDTKMDLNCRLWSILRNRIHCGATDPRDMIFAHLGIISDKAAVLEYVKVDYAQSTTEVFTAAARYIRKYIGTLPLMRTLANFRTDSILPSWVPDWGRQISREMTEQGSEKSFPTSLTSSSRVEPFTIETATEILAVSSVLSLAPLDLSGLFSRLERTQMGFQQGGAGGYDSIGWEKFADALSDAGVDRIAVEEIASSWQNLAIHPSNLSIQQRIYMALYRHYEYASPSPPQCGRLALLNSGLVMVVPEEALSRDFVIRINGDDDGYSRRSSGNLLDAFIVARPYASPVAKICEVDYIAMYKAVSSHGGGTYKRDTIMFLHGLFVGTISGSGGEQNPYPVYSSMDLTVELTSNWSAYDIRSSRVEALPDPHECIKVLFLH